MENIDRIFFINLDRRTDRLEEITKELKTYNFPNDKIERFSAIEFQKDGRGEEGAIGCSMSHLEILKISLKKGYENILVLEDDFKFIVDKENFNKNLTEFFRRYKNNYDSVMLSYNLKEFKEKDELVGYVKKAQTTSGFIINKNLLPELINTIEEGIKNLINTREHWKYSIDVCWFPLQKKKEWFYFKERMGVQRPSYSDCSQRFCNYMI
mgnify:CR=1 FL=1